MKHDWNTWLKNRVLREAGTGHQYAFKFEFEEEALTLGSGVRTGIGNQKTWSGADENLIDVKFIVNADWNKEEPMVKYGDNPYPGSPGHWEWDIEKILEVHPESLDIPENEIIDSLRKRLDSKYDAEMQERLSDEAEKRSPGPDWDLIGKEKKYPEK